MKNKLFFIIFCLFLFIPTVNGTNLTNVITTNDGLGNISRMEKSYDSDNDVTLLNVKVVLSDSLIETVLNQKPGNTATLGTYYFTLNPNLKDISKYSTTVKFQKKNNFFTDKSLSEAKTQIQNSLTTAGTTDMTSYDTVWPFYIRVQYSDGTKWNNITTSSTGSGVSNKTALLTALNTTEDKLEYGVNYRLYMYTTYYWLYGFEAYNSSNTSLGKEYIKVTYELLFPIIGKLTTGGVYYSNLGDALNSGQKEIELRENLIVDEDITVPAGVSLKVVKGVTLYVTEGHKINNNGMIINDGTIKIGEEIYTVVNPKTFDNIYYYIGTLLLSLIIVLIYKKCLKK